MSEPGDGIVIKKTAVLLDSEAARGWLEGLLRRLGLEVEQLRQLAEVRSRLQRAPALDLLIMDFDLLGADYHQALDEFSSLGLGQDGRPEALLLSRRFFSAEARRRLGQAGAGAVLSSQSGWPDLLFAINRLLFPKIRELRRYNRVFGGFPARIESQGRGQTGSVYNISQEGAFIACDQPPPEGSRLVVIFEPPGTGRPLQLEARVTWVNGSGPDEDPTVPAGVGVQFISLDRPEHALLGQFISARERESGHGT